MLTGDFHQTAIAVARGVGMLLEGSQLVIIQARSELQSTAQAPSHAPPAFDSSPSLRLPAHPEVSISAGSGKPDGQTAGSSQVPGTTTADKAVTYDPVSPFCAAQEQSWLQQSSQRQSCQQGAPQEPQHSCQQGVSQQPAAQQHSLHQQSYQVKPSGTASSVSPLKVDTAQPVCLQPDADQVLPCVQRSSCEDLVFTLQSVDEEEEIDAQRAIKSLAQVDCTCKQCLMPCATHLPCASAVLLLCMSLLPAKCLPDSTLLPGVATQC